MITSVGRLVTYDDCSYLSDANLCTSLVGHVRTGISLGVEIVVIFIGSY